MRCVLLAILLVAACAPTEVGVTVDLQGLPEADLLRMTDLRINVAGVESSEDTLATNDDVLREKEGRFVYRTSRSGMLDFTVTVRASEECIARGSQSLTTHEGGFVPVRITPTADGCNVPLPGSDLGGDRNLGGDMGTGEPTSPNCASLPSATVCDDFEGSTLDETKWVAATGATTSISVERHLGRGALRAHLAASSEFVDAFIDTRRASDPFYARVIVSFDKSFPVRAGSFLVALESESPHQAMYVALAESLKLKAGSENIVEKTGGKTLVAETWICLEWRVASSENDTRDLRVWLDGAEELHLSGGVAETPFSITRFGLQMDQPPAPVDFWFDQIAVGVSRIACP